jgi:hypothetical protein
MSYYFRALPWRIPEVLLLARPGTELILVSPWVEDVVLRPPCFGSGPARWQGTALRLGEFLLCLSRDYHHPIALLVRTLDQRAERVVRAVGQGSAGGMRVVQVPHLHAKAIVTESFALRMSANLLETSLSRNVETCALTPNPYGSARQWVERELGVNL